MNEMNLFNYKSYVGWRKLCHPIVFLRFLCRAFKMAWQRAVKGYCNWDLWDMDFWLTHVLPPMLTELAEKGHSYPGREPFETPEKWRAWLNSMASDIASLQNDWADTKNEFAEQFLSVRNYLQIVEGDKHGLKVIKPNDTPEVAELRKKWLDRSAELAEQQTEFTIKTFAELGKHLQNLWD